MKRYLLVLLALLLVVVCCSAGCTALTEEPRVNVLSIESPNTGYSWTVLFRVTNANDVAVDAELECILLDKYGNEVSDGYSYIKNIPAHTSKTARIDVYSTRYLDQVYVDYQCTFHEA